MTDIVERARLLVPKLGAVVPVDLETTSQLAMALSEAAAEIKRLRQALEEFAISVQEQGLSIQTIELWANHKLVGGRDVSLFGSPSFCRVLAEAARAALNTPPTEDTKE